jgi:hypothetical protein
MLKNLISLLLGGWSYDEIKGACKREAKALAIKLLKAIIFLAIWKKLEEFMTRLYENIWSTQKEHDIPEDDFDFRDVDNFVKNATA